MPRNHQIWPEFGMSDQKPMWTRCLGWFSVMWVTKLLIFPVKKGFFAQKPPNLARIWHFWPLLAHLVPCWWVGWWLWRAGCISQDTYLLYFFATNPMLHPGRTVGDHKGPGNRTNSHSEQGSLASLEERAAWARALLWGRVHPSWEPHQQWHISLSSRWFILAHNFLSGWRQCSTSAVSRRRRQPLTILFSLILQLCK